jgi:hypothetical protein
MRVFLVIAVLAGLTWLFVVQKQQPQPKTVSPAKSVTMTAAAPSPRPASQHNWMKSALDRTNEVKSQVAQQRKNDPNK